MSFPARRNGVAIAEPRRRTAANGVYSGGSRTLPRLGDREARRVEPAISHEVVPSSPQLARSHRERRPGINR
jgi:hypothetical protein